MRRSGLSSPLATVTTVLVVLFLLAPLAVVVLFSFHNSASLSLPFRGFSLRWYRDVFEAPDFRDALWTSIRISLVVTAITVVIGTAASYGITLMRGRAKGPVNAIFFIPLALPQIVLGLALLTAAGRIEIDLGTSTIVLGQILWVLPVYVLIALAALTRVDPAYRELAASLGAGPFQTFFRVVLPQVWPVLVAGTALVFALSLDEFPITYWVNGSTTTVPLYIFARIGRTIDPSINAVSTLLMLFTVSALLIGFLALLKSSSRNADVS